MLLVTTKLSLRCLLWCVLPIDCDPCPGPSVDTSPHYTLTVESHTTPCPPPACWWCPAGPGRPPPPWAPCWPGSPWSGAASWIFLITMIPIVTRYSYESTSVEDLYQLVAEETLQHKRRLDNLAFLLSGSEKVVLSCAADKR